MSKRIAACVVAVVVRARPSRRGAADAVGAAHHLRRRVADGRLPGARPDAAVQLRRLEHARDADPERRAGGHLRVGGAPEHAAALQAGARRQAGHVHLESARADRPEVEPGGHPLRLRPEAQAGEARDRRRGRARRRLHAHRAAQDGPHVRALEGREPGDGRARGHRQGRARAGGRGLRLRHGRARGRATTSR